MRKVTEYDTLGNIRSISYNNALHQMDSIAKYFDEQGRLIATACYKNGKRNGESRWYYPDGQLEQSVSFIDNQRTGNHNFYNNGKLRQISFFKIINGQSFLNAALAYDKNDSIITEESHYAEIYTEQDTIRYGDCVDYEIGWICEKDVYVRALTGNIDANFTIRDSSTLKQVNLDAINCYTPVHYGLDTLRIIFEYKQHKVIDGHKQEYRGKTCLDHVFYVIPSG